MRGMNRFLNSGKFHQSPLNNSGTGTDTYIQLITILLFSQEWCDIQSSQQPYDNSQWRKFKRKI